MTAPDAASLGRVLVTGARGFIGRRLLARGAALGHGLTAFSGRLNELPGLADRFDAVVHLAAVTRPPANPAERLALYETNVAGTQAVLDYCAAAGAAVVLASTSGVYRRREDAGPLGEDAPLDPASDYALSKWLAERLCRRHGERTGAPGAALRFFNVYGPGQPGTFLVPEVVARLLAREPVVLRSPEAVRDFVAVDDVVSALLAAVAGLVPGRFAVYNIGGGRGARVIDLVREAGRVLGVEAAIDLTRAGPERDRVVADIARAEADLGWRPTVSLPQGLEAVARDLAGAGGG